MAMEAAAAVQANVAWLLSASLIMLAVLVLDRVADYEGSHVVLPVRDAAAQALACCALHMSQAQQQALLQLLVRLQQAQAWEVRSPVAKQRCTHAHALASQRYVAIGSIA